MKAELIFVGTELLLGDILNTNAQYLARRLSDLGIDNYFQVTVGDNADRLAFTVRRALERSDVVIATGGLGPTMDDLTKETIADVLGLPLVIHEPSLARIEGFFKSRGRQMTENNRKQALLPGGAIVMTNEVGTAPGMIIEWNGKAVAILPGPPNEMAPMFEDHLAPYLARRSGGEAKRLVSLTLKFCGIGESAVEAWLDDLIRGQSDPTIAPYAKMGEVHLRLATKASSEEEGYARLRPIEEEIRQRLGHHIFGTDRDLLEAAVGGLLRARDLTLALAESCTGGLLAKRLTDIPGSSDYFLLGAVTYANSAKIGALGVPEDTLVAHGAVSEETARAMAEGVRRLSGADLGLAITGIAGPSGGTPEKPVGTVHFALASRGETVSVKEQLWGSRSDIRIRAAQAALVMLWRSLKA